MSKESLHWADQIAQELKRRAETDEALKKITKEKGFIVYDEKTPSGKIHIGSGRGWVIHDVIAKALRDIGLKGRFILSSDDIDPFDKMNADLDPKFEQYLGVPFRNIPSPVKGYESFAEYYFMQCVEKFEEYGIEAEIEKTGERYDKGDFNPVIKKVLDNADKINNIYERFYGKAPQKLPFNPVCEKCGKIGTTLAYEWDKEREVLKYRCTDDLVEWAKGCGHEGEISPYNGNGKFPWKVEWAAKWPTVGVMCELAGKDHFTPGGSRSIAIAISDEIFNFPPPYPSTRKKIGKAYEFFTIGGRKMSTSKGTGIGFVDSTEYAPAKILRYLLVATRPMAVIDFDPVTKNDLILLYERFDKTERIYFGKEKNNNPHEVQKHKRIYELSHVGKIPKKIPPQIPFTLAATTIQVALNKEKSISLLQKLKHLPEKLSKEDSEYINERIDFAKKWLDNFAPEQYKFTLNKEVPKDLELDEKQKKSLHILSKKLENKYDEKTLFEEFYEIIKEEGITPGEFFSAAYKVLISKEKGPKLAPFILTIGKKKVAEMFGKV